MRRSWFIEAIVWFILITICCMAGLLFAGCLYGAAEQDTTIIHQALAGIREGVTTGISAR